ncbi:MAG: hypothetical protein LBP33_00185 [Candidatus Adiutrix sp.]|jgi:methionine synthase II (cobalamin-independent)|nr:hypothetical protein [Candidatus Adiutrix sp.]
MKYPQAFSTTAIGSAPYLNIEEAVEAMSGLDIPAYPQMVKMSPWEDMFLGAVEGLPALLINRETLAVRAKRHDRENDLADFYAKFLAGERDFLALAPEAGQGFTAFLNRASRDPLYGPDFLKVQIIGPLTFGQMVLMEDEQSTLVDDPELLEATALALGGKAAWEARRVRALGRTPVVFIDEPGLASFGSAFSTLSRETVIKTMNQSAEVLRADGPALIGGHICGNTDWGMIMESGLDIINFDAYEIMEQFSLYPGQLRLFLEKGGLVAWGIVPSRGFSPDLTADFLVDKLHQGWRRLDRLGAPLDLIASRAIITTACGLGMLPRDLALAATKMTGAVAEKAGLYQ